MNKRIIKDETYKIATSCCAIAAKLCFGAMVSPHNDNLKEQEVEPEFAGKLNFYVSAVDELLKSDDDNSSVGLLICKSKDETTVKWSFRDISKPIGVAEYQLKKLVDKTLNEIEQSAK